MACKQEDSGRNVFAIEYYDTQEKKIDFYPDFIIKENKVYLLIKSGNTANHKKQQIKQGNARI